VDTVLYAVANGIATITMNRPDALNALNEPLAIDLAEALTTAGADRGVRCIVLTGAGRAFCAGADLKPIEAFYRDGKPAPVGEILRDRYNKIVEPIVDAEKPVIASVNGVAAGAGASLALACDFRIASDKARFYQAFIKIGLIPDSGATFFLPRLVGTAKAIELAMLGDIVDAPEALRIGLVTRVVPHGDLDEETRAFAASLAAGPTRAYGLTRRALLFGAVHDVRQTLDFEADLQQELATSPDHQESVMAFLEKRPPEFKGR
jgi:2-(1,2-epoxy-1,2-dihydrophenyl)acetyl-CoA isomerase